MDKNKPEWECIGEHAFSSDTDIVITDPCYIGSMDWDEKEAFCSEHGLVSRTFYGDWGCTVYKHDGEVGKICGEKIGNFTADGGMVCVLSMEDALKLDPGFQKWIEEHSWCVCVIKGFKGIVRLMTHTEECTLNTKSEGVVKYKDVELHIRGDGEVAGEKFTFESIQTSL